jgi:hypothetical protein
MLLSCWECFVLVLTDTSIIYNIARASPAQVAHAAYVHGMPHKLFGEICCLMLLCNEMHKNLLRFDSSFRMKKFHWDKEDPFKSNLFLIVGLVLFSIEFCHSERSKRHQLMSRFLGLKHAFTSIVGIRLKNAFKKFPFIDDWHERKYIDKLR